MQSLRPPRFEVIRAILLEDSPCVAARAAARADLRAEVVADHRVLDVGRADPVEPVAPRLT